MEVLGQLMHQINHPLYQYNQEDICCAVFVYPKKEYFFSYTTAVYEAGNRVTYMLVVVIMIQLSCKTN